MTKKFKSTWSAVIFSLIGLFASYLLIGGCNLNSSDASSADSTATPTSNAQTTQTPSGTPGITPTTTGDYMLGAEEVLGVDGSFLDLASEENGNLHLVYSRSEQIYYMNRINGSWSGEMAVPDGGGATDRFYPSIGCSSDGTVHIIWINKGMTAVYHQTYHNGNWGQRDTAIEGIWPTNRPDIDISSDGTVFVVCQKSYGIAYGINDGSGWYSGDYIYYSTPREPQYPRVAAGKNGVAHVIFSSYWGVASETGELGYSEYNKSSNTWSAIENPFLITDNPGLPEIFIDSKNRTHIFWLEWTQSSAYSRIGYSRLSNGSWSDPYILIDQSFIGFLDGEPHMNFIEGNNDVFCLTVPRFRFVSSYHNAYFFILKGDNNWEGPFLIADIHALYQQEEYPALTFTQGRFHFCWRDLRGSIYYRWMQVN